MSIEPVTPSLRDLLSTISSDVKRLGSQTLTLAQLEISAVASTIAWSGVGLLASLFIAIMGAAVLISALVLIAIALGLPAWAAALSVGLLLTIGGALSARYFVGKVRSVEPVLKETRESLQETLEWLKLQAGN